MKIMVIQYDYFTGHPNSVKPQLDRSLRAYSGKNSGVKVGITSDPKRRASQHSGDGWDRLIVKYKTSSVNYINQIEKYLIDHHWDSVTNQRGGGGGPNANGPYYLYFLIRK